MSGCQKPAPPMLAPAANNTLAPAGKAVADKANSYLHAPSGVEFVYPEGWKNLGTTDLGKMVTLGLRKEMPPTEVTLYWSKQQPETTADQIGMVEYEAMKAVHGDKASMPEPIQFGDKAGYLIRIAGGPAGTKNNDLRGVVYVFFVDRDGQHWKIKLRATSTPEGLPAIEELVKNYRW